MREPLRPCASCAQHIRASERQCPFCDAPVPDGFGDAATDAASLGRPISRAALLFVGAAVAAACSGSETTSSGGSDASGDVGADVGASDGSTFDSPVALYGPAPVDASPDTSDGGIIAAYGPPPVDSGGG